MPNGLTVWLEALDTSSTAWGDHADILVSARSEMFWASLSVDTLGTEVSASVTAFFDDWIEAIAELHGDAFEISHTLHETRTTYAASDENVKDAMANLLPWSQRTLDPEAD